MNSSNNKQLNGLLTSTGLSDQKDNLVLGFTGGRSSSRADLTDAEALQMIAWLKLQNKNVDERANKMRRKIISYAHRMRWYIEFTQTVDMQRLNGWCIKYGYLHKPLKAYTYKELPALVTQFKAAFMSVLSKL